MLENISLQYDLFTVYMASRNFPIILILGLFLFFGQLFSVLFQNFKLPSIVGLLVGGIFIGSSGLNIVNSDLVEQLAFIPSLALAFVAMSLGLEFRWSTVRSLGWRISILIISEAFATFFLIGLGVWALTGSLALGVAMGAVGCASAPSAPLAIVKEYKARGPLTSTIFAVTGFDDAVGIIIFSFASVISINLYSIEAGLVGHHVNYLHDLVVKPLTEIGLAFLIGGLLGFIYKVLTTKVNASRILLLWLLSMMFIAEGLSSYWDFSLILTNMVMGLTIINLVDTEKQQKILSSLENLMPVIFNLFFVYAGSQLNLASLPQLGLLGLVYILSRGLGKWLGCMFGSQLARLDTKIKKYAWTGLLSQIGVGLGLALILIEKFSELGADAKDFASQVLLIVTATSLVFEIIAPVLTRWGLVKAGEIDLQALATAEEE